MKATETPGEIFRAKINLETSKIAWKELQRFFAGGKAWMASADLDLVDVAFQMSKDNVEQIRQWAVAGKLALVPDEQARKWIEADALVWAVVVSPWVLVQPVAKLH
ncbi:MAG: hypothetical protein A3F73_04435 [Gallionellales bacterium RIFCSPLOWO2_12_FULL_59_22]|nr:MAG: hypothetical protein A3H99_07975 [Gallionellales bacterium RIFCSPLOWO2_02_FULL_59_110]OGT03734.1 MAG: hypothetical protein A2Z65_12455 [Gallionellales bacterium RIFCSPLOWO2_02_58_13]OGT14234.1 MAG: hypothetical protein A3F73_04435 [Gallionellales bacterium RIFCSPLOWO2_12_FULL_59_22]